MRWMVWPFGLSLMTAVLACNPGSNEVSGLQATRATPPFEPFGPMGTVTNRDVEKAATLLGLTPSSNPGPHDGKCAGCHADLRTEPFMNRLYVQAAYLVERCIRKKPITQAEAMTMVNCLRADFVTGEAQVATPARLGFLSAGLEHPFIKDVFRLAQAEDHYKAMVNASLMPQGGPSFPAADFELIYRWMRHGMPGLNQYLASDGPQSCLNPNESYVGERVKEHIVRMSLRNESWSARNRSNGMVMAGCNDELTLNCLQQKDNDGNEYFPVQSDITVTERKNHRIRLLQEINNEFRYWVRSSADGRYVAGGGDPSFVLDLAPRFGGEAARRITVLANYDPGFLPNNQGIIFQGQRTYMCRQSVLDDPAITELDFQHQDCAQQDLQVGLYQGIGSSMNTLDITTVSGGYLGDDGVGRLTNQIPLFRAEERAFIKIFDPGSWELKKELSMLAPYHGNWNLSPSNQLLLSVISGADELRRPHHGGYHLARFDDFSGLTEGFALDSLPREETAKICVGAGEKPQFSFSERFLAFHRYQQESVVNGDPTQGSSDIYLVDLLKDLQPQAVTRMGPGQYAQFPHFRSDGWMYFVVRDTIQRKSFLMASNIAVLIP